MSKMPVLDPYQRGYLMGVAAAKRHGPLDEKTLAKLRAIAHKLDRYVDRPKEPTQ